jgi:4-amino-4-deoxy-L-arabinose transferase-like glycosyltransferase
LPAAAIGFFLLARGWRVSAGARLWLIYAALVAVLITVTAERRMRYLFPLYPALSVASGAALAFAVQRTPRLLRVLVILAAVGATIMVAVSRKGSKPANSTRDAVQAARRIEPGESVWITHRTQYGRRKQPSIAKTIGFYAAPLVRACQADCVGQATPGSIVVARADEAEQVAAGLGGSIEFSNKTVALVRIPGSGGGR